MNIQAIIQLCVQWLISLITSHKEAYQESAEKDLLIVELEEEVQNLRGKLEGNQHQIFYDDFIPNDWTSISEPVKTNKYVQEGIILYYDIRDLLNSTIYSRDYARDVIDSVGFRQEDETLDEFFNRLSLATANLVIKKIRYVTNDDQFKVSDRWLNGDTCLETSKGDCDLSVRCFVRILNDVLNILKMYAYQKYVFQAVGFYKNYGHSWGLVYDPVEKLMKLVECTLDTPYSTLTAPNTNYDEFFCVNFEKVWRQSPEWRMFL